MHLIASKITVTLTLGFKDVNAYDTGWIPTGDTLRIMYKTNALYIIFKLPDIDFMIVYSSKHLSIYI